MAIETTAAGGALIKIFGIPVLAGAAATSLGFMFMWPKSAKEAFVRFFVTIVFSVLMGPALVLAVRSWWPSLFENAKDVALMYGSDRPLGFLFIAALLMVAAGLVGAGRLRTLARQTPRQGYRRAGARCGRDRQGCARWPVIATVTLGQLQAIMPLARARASSFMAPLNVAMLEFGINTLAHQASFLAQLGHEFGQLVYVREL